MNVDSYLARLLLVSLNWLQSAVRLATSMLPSKQKKSLPSVHSPVKPPNFADGSGFLVFSEMAARKCLIIPSENRLWENTKSFSDLAWQSAIMEKRSINLEPCSKMSNCFSEHICFHQFTSVEKALIYFR